ncbi:MAG: cation:dicarboxylase symporter family transporter, partial [Anaerococcus sp.]|nr:cation:dicarboxylase symporter family transporter [Anaerococcus sp.]
NMELGSNEFKMDTGEKTSMKDTLLNMIPTNPIEALAKGDMLQIIIFAVIVGLLIAGMEDRMETLGNIITEMNDLMMSMTMAVMKLAPIGVFFLIARTFSNLDENLTNEDLSNFAKAYISLSEVENQLFEKITEERI